MYKQVGFFFSFSAHLPSLLRQWELAHHILPFESSPVDLLLVRAIPNLPMRVIIEVHVSRLRLFTPLRLYLFKPGSELLMEFPILLLQFKSSPVLLVSVLLVIKSKEQRLDIKGTKILHSIVHRLGREVLKNIHNNQLLVRFLLFLLLLFLRSLLLELVDGIGLLGPLITVDFEYLWHILVRTIK